MTKPVMNAPTNGGDFEKKLPTEGLVNAKCFGVVDLGSVETEWKGVKKMTRKVQLNFETDQMADFGDKGELPLCLFNTYTFFLSEQANLYKDIMSWFGKVDTSMNIFDLVGKTAELMISHETTKAGKPFAKIVKIKPGKKDWELINPEVMVSLEKEGFDLEEFKKLPDRLQANIAKTPEYQKLHVPLENNQTDEIPF